MQTRHALIVYAHPEPKSFNAALRDAAADTLRSRGWEVEVSDLYAMHFDPVFKAGDFLDRQDTEILKPSPEALHALQTGTFAPDIAAEIEKVRRAGLIIFQFPIYFTSVPAILKGWIDRVFKFGFAFDYGHMYGNGLLAGKQAMLVVTTGANPELYSADGPHGDIHELFRPITHCTFEFTGMTVLPTHLIFSAGQLDQEAGAAEIERYRRVLEAV
jgi:NAD(P)H dehydrogenase (quinone)